MKVGIVTDAFGPHISGGILCIIEVLNTLKKDGHEVCAFLNHPPYRSDWLHTDFPIYPISEMQRYDGILVAPYSPMAKLVAEAPNAEDRFYWVHSNEALFTHNGTEWQMQAKESYTLPLKIFCVSHYLQIIMEQIFNRYIIGITVPPGIDSKVFYPGSVLQNDAPVNIGILYREEWVRGLDIALLGFKIAEKRLGKGIQSVIFGNINDRKKMADTLRMIDIYVDTSRLAGSPTPVKEAMACGAIPVCTYYGATDFVLSGYNGYIIPPDNPIAVSDTIIYLVQRGVLFREHMAKQAEEYTRQWTWDHVADRFVSAIMEGQEKGDDLLKFRGWKHNG